MNLQIKDTFLNHRQLFKTSELFLLEKIENQAKLKAKNQNEIIIIANILAKKYFGSKIFCKQMK